MVMSHYIPRIVGNICWFYSITSQWSPIEATLNHHHHRQNHMHIPWNHHQIPTTFQQKTSHSTFITPGVMALLRSGRCQNHTTLLSRKDGDKTSSFLGCTPFSVAKPLKSPESGINNPRWRLCSICLAVTSICIICLYGKDCITA